jgi:uncharacterized membrane protein
LQEDWKDSNNSSSEEKWGRRRLLASLEGRILGVALILSALYLAWLGFGCPGFQQKTHVFMGMTTTIVFFGRMAGMSFGYAMGLEQIVVVPIAMIVESLAVLLFYPLFVLSLQRLLVVRAFKNLMERIQRTAETHGDKIVKYGIAGLLAFVWFPFFMTGPIVGSAIGHLMGLRAWVNLTIVLVGNCLAVLTWAIILGKIRDRVAAYNPYAPVILVAIGIVILAAIYVFRSMRRQANSRRS